MSDTERSATANTEDEIRSLLVGREMRSYETALSKRVRASGGWKDIYRPGLKIRVILAPKQLDLDGRNPKPNTEIPKKLAKSDSFSVYFVCRRVISLERGVRNK